MARKNTVPGAAGGDVDVSARIETVFSDGSQINQRLAAIAGDLSTDPDIDNVFDAYFAGERSGNSYAYLSDLDTSPPSVSAVTATDLSRFGMVELPPPPPAPVMPSRAPVTEGSIVPPWDPTPGRGPSPFVAEPGDVTYEPPVATATRPTSRYQGMAWFDPTSSQGAFQQFRVVRSEIETGLQDEYALDDRYDDAVSKSGGYKTDLSDRFRSAGVDLETDYPEERNWRTNIKEAFSDKAGMAFGIGYSALSAGQGASKYFSMQMDGRYYTPEQQSSAESDALIPGAASFAGMAIGAAVAGPTGMMAGQFVGQAAGGAVASMYGASEERGQATRETSERLGDELGAAVARVREFSEALSNAGAPIKELQTAIGTVTGVAPVAPSNVNAMISGAAIYSNALGERFNPELQGASSYIESDPILRAGYGGRVSSFKMSGQNWGNAAVTAAAGGDLNAAYDMLGLEGAKGLTPITPQDKRDAKFLGDYNQEDALEKGWDVISGGFTKGLHAVKDLFTGGSGDFGSSEDSDYDRYLNASQRLKTSEAAQQAAAEKARAADATRVRNIFNAVEPGLASEESMGSSIGVLGSEEEIGAVTGWLPGQFAKNARGIRNVISSGMPALQTGVDAFNREIRGATDPVERAKLTAERDQMVQTEERFKLAGVTATHTALEEDIAYTMGGYGVTRSGLESDLTYSRAGTGTFAQVAQGERNIASNDLEQVAAISRMLQTNSVPWELQQPLTNESNSLLSDAQTLTYNAPIQQFEGERGAGLANVSSFTAGLPRSMRLLGNRAITDGDLSTARGIVGIDDREIARNTDPKRAADLAAMRAADEARYDDLTDTADRYMPNADEENAMESAQLRFKVSELMPWMDGPQSNPLTRGIQVERMYGQRIQNRNAERAQLVKAGNWDAVKQQNYIRGDGEDQLALANMEHERMTSWMEAIPEMVIGGGPGTGAIQLSPAMSAKYMANPWATGSWGASANAPVGGTVTSGGEAGNFTAAGMGGGASSEVIALLREIAGHLRNQTAPAGGTIPGKGADLMGHYLANHYLDPHKK